MRIALTPLVFAAMVGLVSLGCGAKKEHEGPTVDAFNGKLVHDGKPVSFPAEEKVQLKLFHEKGESFGVPIQPDGTFQIGWMPIGKYSATLLRESNQGGKKAGSGMHSVPGGLTIKEGQTEYVVELGKNWKP